MITLLTNSCSHSSDTGINEDSNDFKLLLEAILDTNHVLTNLPTLQSKAKGVLSESLHLRISDESPRFGLLIGQKLKKNADGNNFYEGLSAQLIAEAYTRKRNIDSSEYWISQAEINFKSDSFQLGIANLDFLKANISIQENRYVDAYNHLNNTLAIYREQGDSGRIIDTSIELAYLFGQLNMFKQSRTIYFQVWDYLKRSEDSKGILVVTNLIAESYYLNYEAGQALIYANQAYDLATKLQDVNQKTFSCNLLGIISLDLKDYSNAIRILKECIVLQ